MILSATAFTDGCALFDDEGEYEAPAGFTPSQTARVAIAPGAFVREGNRVLSGTAAARRARGGDVDVNAPSRIESEFFGSYAEGMRVNASTNPRAYVDVVPEGAAAVPGRVRNDGAVVAFEEAFPGVTSAFGADHNKVEEFLTIPSLEAVPALSYVLRDGPEFGGWVEADGRLWAVDKQGESLFNLAPPVVEDAVGNEVVGRWTFEKVEGGVRIRPDLDWTSLEFPVLFDPTFETPLWFLADRPVMPTGRAASGSAFYPLGGHNCSVIFGGIGPNAAYRNDVAVYCGALWQRGDVNTGIPTNATRPTARAYVGMAYASSGVTPGIYSFGGYTSTGLSNELWRLNLGGTPTAKTATWTKINPPVPTTSANWPSLRYLPGLGHTTAGLVLFGGVDVFGHPLKDTWLYNGTTWTKVCDNCFQGRFGFASAQMGTEAAPELVAFGGYDEATNSLTNTVQRFTGTGWQTVAIDPLSVPANATNVNLTGDVAPQGRYLAFAARTPDNNLLVGSGINFGTCGSNAEFSDAWIWRRQGGENRWSIVPSSPTLVTPGKRESASAVYDPSRAEILLYGGRSNCSSTAAGALPGNSRAYRNNKGNVALSVTCIDTGAVGGPNGNTCDTYRLRATVSGIANDTNPTRMRAVFFRRRGATWQGVSTACSSTGSPMTPNSGGSTFQCDAPAFASGAIDTGFTVRLRDSGYATGGSQCGTALNTPACIPIGFEAAASCVGDPMPSGNNNVVNCVH